MPSDEKNVTCSMVLDRDFYNKFKSVCYKEGKSVKECIVEYMKEVIALENLSDETKSE